MGHQKNDNYEHNSDFLKSAISDLAGNLALVDTKISIILATVVVVLGLVVACKSSILRAYDFYSNTCVWKALFLFLSFACIVSIILTFVFGVRCVMIRFGKSKTKSLWFFRTEEYGGISEKNYIEKAIKSTDDTILNSLASEVYKLNKINNKKMNEGKKTIVFFSISCGIISVLMMMVAVFYLVA